MPEGPEVKIASSYYNSFFDGAKISNLNYLLNIMKKSMQTYLTV